MKILDSLGLRSLRKSLTKSINNVLSFFSFNPNEGLKEHNNKKTPSKNKIKSVHLTKSHPTTTRLGRIQSELKAFLKSPPPHIRVTVGSNLSQWIIHLTFPPTTAYPNETYKLKITFPSDYPTSPPSCYFLKPTPAHEHVYTNGDICLSLLGSDWRPTMSAETLAVSIMSMLSSAGEKSRPMDNSAHAAAKPGGRQDNWVYHDDSC
ncbi:hypothetical protein TL16_g08443 [Triparma laevis f. inornata]|uniref:UBC core domain-containing protein n=1 Tax=Triparma laevis f. inornata TaxID=1714386 RepID=A0A9W7AYB8_9STRA|nr:hypothetical protein TL16_g08443 [Triparma laevis f. inornata]